MSPKLLAFDFDGTLYDEHEKRVPEENYAALKRLHAAGHYVALITGRWDLPADVLRQIPHHARATSNGGQVRFGNEVQVQHVISQEDVRKIIAHTHPRAELYAFSDQHFFTRSPDGERSQRWQVHLPVKPFEDIHGHTVLKMNVDHTSAAELKGVLARELPHLTLTGGQVPYQNFLTITPTQANKAAALAYIAERLGVPLQNTVVFGDSDNDLEMLRMAGHAVQVGHMEYLQEVSDEQLDHPAEVATWLQRFLDTVQA